MSVESGLHQFLSFSRELPRLLERVGVDIDAMVCWEAVQWDSGDGARAQAGEDTGRGDGQQRAPGPPSVMPPAGCP